MTIDYLIKGGLIGLSIAAPVGPIGVLTIKRTLTEGRRSGFVTGLGAAFADATYGAVAGFGLTAVSSFMMTYAFGFKLIGGLFLLYLGIKSFLSKPATKEARVESKGLFNNFISTFFLTVSNPATIFSFLAIFTGLGLGTTNTDYASSMLLVFGVFFGSALWWFILSGIVNYFQLKITPNRMIWINRFSGLIIISFGLWALYGCAVILQFNLVMLNIADSISVLN
jgi:threonine/homoserine/homoserine lactone efflux protein